MSITTLFTENFSLEMGLPLGIANSSFSLVPTATGMTGGATATVGTSTLENVDPFDDSLISSLGSAIINTGTNVACSSYEAYEKTLEELNTTQAYMESLEQEELEELIIKLEDKKFKLSLVTERQQKVKHI